MIQPLILLTNDDGIDSPGLRAAVDAVSDLGEVVIAAPDRQWSGSGRSMPPSVTGQITQVPFTGPSAGRAYAIDATPALCIIHAMAQLVDRRPNLVISGVNFGENIGVDITISGTVGAAIEAAAFGIPALAVSVEMPVENHLVGDTSEDYGAARAFTRYFTERLLAQAMPFDADILSINLPQGATPDTPWQLTRLSRRRYFIPVERDPAGKKDKAGYRVMDHPELTEIGSDIWCLHFAHQVSVTPLSLDLTARTDFGALEEQLRREA